MQGSHAHEEVAGGTEEAEKSRQFYELIFFTIKMTNFIGTVTGANGGLIFLTIAGPNHFGFNQNFTGSFNLTQALSAGTYTVTVSAAVQTPGNFSFDITGDLTSVNPTVPMNFNNGLKMFTLIV